MRLDVVELEPELIERAALGPAELLVLPVRVADGMPVYPESAVTAVKALRADGQDAAFLDDAPGRTFECKNSSLLDAAIAFAVGIASTSAFEGMKHLLQRRRTRFLRLTALDLRPDSPTRGMAWSAEGETDEVLEALQTVFGLTSLAASQEDDQPVGNPARTEFEEAGPADDLRREYLESQVRSRQAEADSLMRRSKAFVARSTQQATMRRAETDARKALALYRGALDWAEDSDLEDGAHSALDGAGRWIRRTFGCHLHQEGDHYAQRCPVALAHSRIGLSVGGLVAVRLCSICGNDFSECEHLPDRSYLVPGGMSDLGWCRACGTKDCEHTPGEMVRASVVAIVTEMVVDEVSLVSRPAHPEARIHSMDIDLDDLQETLGDEFSPGDRVSCDRCLHPCGGLDRHVLPHW